MEPSARTDDLPPWLWLYLPFALFGALIAAHAAGEQAYERWMRSEISVPELGTLLWLLVAVVLGLALLRRRAALPSRALAGWLALFTLGCFFFAGEEASWGQHYFGWQTPEALAAANEQGETGIHNLEGIGWIFDQAPRAALTGAAILALLTPLLARWQPALFGRESRLHWFLPTYVCIPVALLALFVRDVEKLAHAAGEPFARLLDMQAGEFKEYFLAYLLMLYAASLWWRTRGAIR